MAIFEQVSCDLAGIRFIFSPLSAAQFNAFFADFLNLDGLVDAVCHVEMVGVDESLRAARARGAWHFERRGAEAVILGANPAGEVMWRLSGIAPYEKLRFVWHPTAYFQMYAQAPAGTFNTAVILALILRLMMVGGVTLHGSAQIVDGKGIICTGPSGNGKSTISRLFAERGVTVLTDERPLLRPRKAGGFQLFGSPWPSSGKFVVNGSAPLNKIYFIEHGSRQELLPLTTREALLRLLDVALVPWLESSFFDPMIPILESVLGQTPYALLRFKPDTTVVDAICQDLA